MTQQASQVAATNDAVIIKVSAAVITACAPAAQQFTKINAVDDAILVQVTHTGGGARKSDRDATINSSPSGAFIEACI
jgi:hypothetical protein